MNVIILINLESEEPIHLCVSSKYGEVFELACQMVEELLNHIYKEFETFCRTMNKGGFFPLQVKKIEASIGSTEKQTPEGFVDVSNYQTEVKDFNVYHSSNSPFYPTENYYQNTNITMHPSPIDKFDLEMFYKQFNQERLANCFQRTNQQQGPNKIHETMAQYAKYH